MLSHGAKEKITPYFSVLHITAAFIYKQCTTRLVFCFFVKYVVIFLCYLLQFKLIITGSHVSAAGFIVTRSGRFMGCIIFEF